VEVSLVRRRLGAAIEAARSRAQQRRALAAETEIAWGPFLEHVATPLVRQVANALKAEGYAFTVFTPAHGLRLASDRGRDDFIEIGLDTNTDPPEVVARVSRTRGSRILVDERPVKPGTPPDGITEEDLLAFLTVALEPWLER
jgi:hypothetical protein